jgi:hypothetical protein
MVPVLIGKGVKDSETNCRWGVDVVLRGRLDRYAGLINQGG